MFDAGSIVAKLKLDNSEFNSGMNDAKKKSAEVSKSLTTLGIAGAAASAAIIGIGSSIFKTVGTFEKYNAVLKIALGSQAEASKSMEQIQKFAAKTPFSVDELTASYIKLVNRGIKPTEKEMTSLGDLASSQGKSFNQLTEAALDAQQSEFERLKEFGIEASAANGKVSLSFKGLNQTVAQTPEAIQSALLKFGEMEGVAGSMAAISQTLEGRISNLGDSFDQLKLAIGEPIKEAFKAFVGAIDSGIQAILKFREENPVLFESIIQVTAALGTLIVLITSGGGLIAAIGTVTSAIGALAGVLGIVAAPALAVTAAIVAISVAAALVATNVIKYWSQMQSVMAPLERDIQDIVTAFGEIKDILVIVGRAVSSMFNFGNAVSKTTDNISYMGTISKVVFAVLIAGVRVAIAVVSTMVFAVRDLLVGIQGLGVAIKNVFQGDFENAAKSAKQGIANLNNSFKAPINTVYKIGEIISDTFNQDFLVKVNTKEAEAKVDALKKKMSASTPTASKKGKEDLLPPLPPPETLSNELSRFGENIAKMLGTSISNGLKNALGAVGEIGKAAYDNLVAGLGNALVNIQRKMQVFDTFAQVTMRKMQLAQQQELQSAEENYNKDLENFKFAENEKLKILQEAQIERQAMRDTELQSELARIENEKLLYLEQQRFLFEQKQIELLANAETQAQETLAKESNEQDWLNFVASVDQEYLDKKTEATTKSREISTTEDQTTRAEIEKQKAESDARIKQKEQEQAASLTAIKNKQESDKTAAEKKAAGIKWIMDSAALNVQKQIQRAQATMQLASGLMGAAASSAALGLAGIPLFAALSGLMYSTYSMSISQISSQFVLPPPELLMKDGGLLGGPSHANGGIPMGGVNAQGGELFIDRERTAKLFDWMDSGKMGGVVVNINAGAFQGVGDLSDESINILGEKIGRAIERRAY